MTLLKLPLSIAALLLYQPGHPRLISWFLLVLFLAVAADYLDGKIARYLGEQSMLGYSLDGLTDRAFHAALILAFVVTGIVPVVVAWMLIFRDIAIYALRLMHPSWTRELHSLRVYSLIHGYCLRFWFALWIASDSLATYMEFYNRPVWLATASTIFISLLATLSFLVLWKMLLSSFSSNEQVNRTDE